MLKVSLILENLVTNLPSSGLIDVKLFLYENVIDIIGELLKCDSILVSEKYKLIIICLDFISSNKLENNYKNKLLEKILSNFNYVVHTDSKIDQIIFGFCKNLVISRRENSYSLRILRMCLYLLQAIQVKLEKDLRSEIITLSKHPDKTIRMYSNDMLGILA